MKNKKHSKYGKPAVIIAIVILVVILAGLREYLAKKDAAAERQAASGESAYASMVSKNDPLLAKFKNEYHGRKILLACKDDVNADSKDDLIVISQKKSSITTIAMLSKSFGRYYFTSPIPAPRENQKIKFINIDKDDDLEIMLTGEKKGQIGYAVYKVKDGKLKDLYGQNMKDCC